MKKTLIILATAILGSVSAAGSDSGPNHEHPWDYTNNGQFWAQKTKKALKLTGNAKNECGGGNQSPIDLTNGFKKVPAMEDNFQKMYNNQVSSNKARPDIKVQWNGHTSQTGILKKGQDVQMFESQHGKNYYGANERYSGAQFHFHHGSEHTINGMRQDLEMHTVHLADGAVQNGFFASAMGIMFSVNDPSREFKPEEVAVIDKFFDDLDWEKTTKTKKLVMVDEVSYGELMMMVDMNNRWTYKGSVTTPPCAENVYWNVLRTVYPIKQMHLDQFKEILKIGNMLETGNWREIQPLTEAHNPTIVMSPEGGSVVILILFIVFLLCTIGSCARLGMLQQQIRDAGLNKVNTVDTSFPAQTKDAGAMEMAAPE